MQPWVSVLRLRRYEASPVEDVMRNNEVRIRVGARVRVRIRC